MRVTNRAGLPQVIVDAVTNDPYSPGDAAYSCTTLLKPPRAVAISRAHQDELEEEAADRFWALLGSAAHVILERANRAGVTEERLYGEIDGVKISGRFDHLENEELSDFKVTSAWSRVFGSNDADYERQLNVLAFLAKAAGYKVKKVFILAIYRDHSQRDLEKDTRGTYPKSPVELRGFRLWSKKEALAFIGTRIRKHEDARRALESGDELPLCTGEERWWDEKKKKSNRCAKYCAAAPWCAQYRAELRGQEGEEL